MTRILLAAAVLFLVAAGALRVWRVGVAPSAATPIERPSNGEVEARQNAAPEPVVWPERNVFVRLNAPVAAEPVQTDAAVRTGYRPPELLGIVMRDEISLVWLRDQSGRAQAYRLGEGASGWQVEEIERTRVRLSIGEREEWIGLFGAGAEPD
jgi:hypothetical protein